MEIINASTDIVLPIGRQGENETTTVLFDVSGWEEEYGDGAFELLHKRSTDTDPYPCSITVDGGKVSWLICSPDTLYAGRGCAQLSYIVRGAIAKSAIYATNVLKSLEGGSNVPEPWQHWVDEILTAGAAAEVAESNSEAWAVGQRFGEDVPDTDITYHNNSKFYSEVAAQHAAEDGFMAFYIDHNGDLIYQRTTNVDVSFRLIDGDLYVGVA